MMNKSLEKLTSRANGKIKSASLLLKASERKKTNRFLLEGARLCGDAVRSGTPIEEFFATEEAAEKYSDIFSECAAASESAYYITPDIAEKLSDTSTTQEMFCVCRENGDNEKIENIDTNGFYVFTENLQNPDNLGAVVRSAEALGADGLIVYSGCDIRSPKALRASMGGLLRFPVYRITDTAEFLKFAKSKGMKVFATVASGDAENIISADKTGGIICIIGNEGNGITDETLALCTNRVTIPMKGKAESLNAAAAAAITVWEFMKERGE